MELYDELIKEKDIKKGKEEKRNSSKVTHIEFNKKRSIKPVLKFFLVAVFFIGVFFIGISNSKTEIIITVNKLPFYFEKSLISIPHEKLAPNQPLNFQAMVLSGDISREILADSLVESYTKATGKVIFFNEFSSKPYTVSKGTAIVSTKNNKKYITQSSVTIPGFKVEAGKRVASVSSPVPVTASAVGRDYNIDGTDFVLSGATGDKKTKLYARSSGVIEGGENGLVHVLTEKSREDVIESLKQLLSEKLRRQARAQVPEGLMTFPDFQFVIFNTGNINFKNQSIKFPVTLSGTLVTYLFPEEALKEELANKAVENNGNIDLVGQYKLINLEGLEVSPASAFPIDPNQIPKELTLQLNGEGRLISKIDTQNLATKLSGKSIFKFDSVVSENERLEEASYKMKPFWSIYFPKKLGNFKIIVK